MATIKCRRCSKDAPYRGGAQLYCEPCSEVRDLERKQAWHKKNGGRQLSPEEKAARAIQNARRDAERREAGAGRSVTVSMAWPAESGEPDMAWIVRVAVPFSYRMSKNAIWASSPRGHTFLRKGARQARDLITMAVRAALRERRIAHNRLWLDIFVEKPNHRGDALNVIDLVADAVKDAAGLDDRWFSIRRMDWSVVTNGQPRIFIGIGQESDVDVLVCSYCGRVQPLDRFNKNKSGPLGRARVCRECSRAEDRVKRSERRRAQGEGPRVEVEVRPIGAEEE